MLAAFIVDIVLERELECETRNGGTLFAAVGLLVSSSPLNPSLELWAERSATWQALPLSRFVGCKVMKRCFQL